MKAIKIIFILLPLTLLSFSLSLVKCNSLACLYSTAVYGVTLFLVGLIVASIYGIILKIKGKSLNLLFYISIPILYLFGGFVFLVGFQYLDARLNISDKVEQAQEISKARNQNYASIQKGKIIDDNSDLIYECKDCGYRVRFPATWGFHEYASGDLEHRDIILATPDYTASSSKIGGAEFNILSRSKSIYPEDDYYEKYVSDPNRKINTGSIEGVIVDSNQYDAGVEVRKYPYYYTIFVKGEVEKYLKTFLQNFEPIE